MTIKSVMFNKNFLLSGGSSFSRRGDISETIDQNGIGFFSMIRDVARNENGRLNIRLTEKDSASLLKSATRSNNPVDSLNSPVEKVRRAFLAKGVPLDQVVLDKNDFESLRTILDKLDFSRMSIDNFFQQMVQDNPGRNTTLADFFKDLTQFEKELNATSSPWAGDAQGLSLDKSIVPHIESLLRDLGVTPEMLDSLLPSVSDVDGNVDLKKLVHQLKEIQSSYNSSDAPESTRDHDAVLTPQLLEAMETMALPTPRQSIGTAFNLDSLIGIMETKLESVSVVSPKFDSQDSVVLHEVSEISERQSMDNGQVDTFFAFAEAMMVRQNFETRQNSQEYTPAEGLSPTGVSLSLSESDVKTGDPSIEEVSILSDHADVFPDFGNVKPHGERQSLDSWKQTDERSVMGDSVRVDLVDVPGILPDYSLSKADGVDIQISVRFQADADEFVSPDHSLESNTVSMGLPESAEGRVFAAEFSRFDANGQANAVNIQSDRQKFQTNEVTIIITDKNDTQAGNGDSKAPPQIFHPGDARDALQESDNFQSVPRTDKSGSQKIHPVQSSSIYVGEDKNAAVVVEARADYQEVGIQTAADGMTPILRKADFLESQLRLTQMDIHEDGAIQSNSVAPDFPKDLLNAEKASMDLPQDSTTKALAGELKVAADVNKAEVVNIEPLAQRLQAHTGDSVLTNKTLLQRDNGEFKIPNQMIYQRDVTDVMQEGRGFHSANPALKTDSAMGQPSQAPSNQLSVGRDASVAAEINPYPQEPVALGTVDKVSPHFKNMYPQGAHFYGSVFQADEPANGGVQSNLGLSPVPPERSHDVNTLSMGVTDSLTGKEPAGESQLDDNLLQADTVNIQALAQKNQIKTGDVALTDKIRVRSENGEFKLLDPMLRTANIPEIQAERNSIQAVHGGDKFHGASAPAVSTSQSISNVTQSLSKAHVEFPRESLSTVPDAGMMEMAVPDQLFTQQDVLLEVKGNKYSLGNRFSLPWNKMDRAGMGAQVITELNGPSQNGNMGISQEIDVLINDIISGTANSEEKFIKSSAQKGIDFDTPGGFERLSMATQSNASTVHSFSQKEGTPATVFPPNVLETVGKEIAAFLQRGERMLKIQLKPVELGTVNIEMDTKENVMKLTVVAETSAARELFLSNHNELRRVLEGHGIRLENLEIQMNDDFSQSMANGDRQSARQRNQRWGTRFARMDKGEDGADYISPMGQSKDSLLDLLV